MPRVIEKDRGWNAIKKALFWIIDGKVASVGIQGEQASEIHGDDGPSNVMIGAVHEFGAPDVNVPERSFIRSTIEAKRSRYERQLVKIAVAGFSGKMLKGRLLLLGEKVRGDILRTIRGGIAPALKAATINRKRGETTPLIDTGQLRNALSAEVTSPKYKRSIT